MHSHMYASIVLSILLNINITSLKQVLSWEQNRPFVHDSYKHNKINTYWSAKFNYADVHKDLMNGDC